MMKQLILFVLLLFTALGVHAQQVSALAKADTAEGLIGRKFRVELKVTKPVTASVEWPVIADSIGHLEILALSPVDTVVTSDNRSNILTRYLDVTAYDSGTYVIPPLKFIARQSGAAETVVTTDPLAIKVFLVQVDTTKDVRDIAPLEEVPYDWTMIIIIVAGVIVLIIAAYFLYKKYRQREQPVPVKEVIRLPAHQVALEALRNLAAQNLLQQGLVKRYHIELTDILRRYLSDRWRLNAMELTTDEITGSSSLRILPDETLESLNWVLRLADLVKFAKVTPMPHENEKSMQEAIRFVELTKQEENKTVPVTKEAQS